MPLRGGAEVAAPPRSMPGLERVDRAAANGSCEGREWTCCDAAVVVVVVVDDDDDAAAPAVFA